jgi:hypothetical protein
VSDKQGIWAENIRKKGVSSPRRDIAVFIFFLFLAFGFWYLNSLRKDFELDLKYPVRYVNPPKGRIVAGDLPPKLTINLKGSGFSIIRLRISQSRSPLVIDFSKITYKRVPNTKTADYYVLSSGLVPNFNRQLGSEFQIMSVKPDTIYVRFPAKSGNGSTGNRTLLNNSLF